MGYDDNMESWNTLSNVFEFVPAVQKIKEDTDARVLARLKTAEKPFDEQGQIIDPVLNEIYEEAILQTGFVVFDLI